MDTIKDTQGMSSLEIVILLLVIYISYRLVRWVEPYFFGAINAKIDDLETDMEDLTNNINDKLETIDNKLTELIVNEKVDNERYNQLERRVTIIEKQLYDERK